MQELRKIWIIQRKFNEIKDIIEPVFPKSVNIINVQQL